MDILPVVAIVGRPNVGKSTLFNALTRTRDALVADRPGVTRDRIYGRVRRDDSAFILVDTGGLAVDPDDMEARVSGQVRAALEEADLVLLMVEAREGLNAQDELIGAELRRLDKPIIVLVNKSEGLEPEAAVAEAYSLGLGEPLAIAAGHRRGLDELLGRIAGVLPAGEPPLEVESDPDRIRLALVGRPNVGKSTLLNRLLGEERALAVDKPGTTRDPVIAEWERDGLDFQLVDTAGIRRRSKTRDMVEKFSVLKALKEIDQAHVVAVLIDAREGVTDQDSSLIGHVMEAGRALVVAVNKWDGLSAYQREQVLGGIKLKLDFARYARVVTISALHGSGLGELFDAVADTWRAASRELPTSALSRILETAVGDHAPPSSRRFIPKLRYAHAVGRFPTRIMIHGNRTRYVPDSYRRYLENRFRAELGLTGVPLKLLFRDGDNPYAGRRNTLTPRQVEKRKRLKRHIKKNR